METQNRARRTIAISIAAVAYLLSQPVISAETVPGGVSCEFNGFGSDLLSFAALGPAAMASLEAAGRSTARKPSGQSAAFSEVLLPPKDPEFKQLRDVFKALAQPGKSPSIFASLDKGQPFSLNRFAVLTGDVRSILIYLEAQELRTQLGKGDRVSAGTRAWIEPKLAIMETCAPARFSGRGDLKAFQNTVSLVKKWRLELLPFVFQVAPEPKSAPSQNTVVPASKTAQRQ